MGIGNSAVPVPLAYYTDEVTEETFGPYSQADFSAANTYIPLPFQRNRPVIIDGVSYSALTGADSFNSCLVRTLSAATFPSGALSTQTKVCELAAPSITAASNYAVVDAKIHPTTGAKNANILPSKAVLWAYGDAIPFGLDQLFITIRYRTCVS